MRILWITNIVFPEVTQLLQKNSELKSSGGWMLGSAEELVKNDEVELTVAAPTPLVGELRHLKGRKMSYYLLPYGKGNIKYNKEYESYWKKIYIELNPDVVHIHGTEFSHGLAFLNSCGSSKVVVSIQGLTSVYYKYYLGGLSTIDILRSITLRDLLRGSVFNGKKDFKQRGKYEIKMLQLVNHVIGRTCWDKAHVWAVNPYAQYHFCNETLRSEFYCGEEWNYNNCIPHSIFISQAIYPIKGLHIVLQAMPLILREYPDAQIRVAGMDIARSKEGYIGRLKISGYGKIIKALIKRYQLSDRVCFLGNLNASEMINEYLNANVFVCPGSIENSPNSLGEAQILGTPVVASYVGGVSDMMIGNEDNLYRFSDVEMCAQKICHIFGNREYQYDMKEIARKRHERRCNLETTIEIYKSIINQQSDAEVTSND